jgi:hypothetical protein
VTFGFTEFAALHETHAHSVTGFDGVAHPRQNLAKRAVFFVPHVAHAQALRLGRRAEHTLQAAFGATLTWWQSRPGHIQKMDSGAAHHDCQRRCACWVQGAAVEFHVAARAGVVDNENKDVKA